MNEDMFDVSINLVTSILVLIISFHVIIDHICGVQILTSIISSALIIWRIWK